MYVIKIYTHSKHVKFQSNVFTFGNAMIKTGKHDYVTFWTLLLVLLLFYPKMNDILRILRKTGQDRPVFARKSWVLKFTPSWLDPDI